MCFLSYLFIGLGVFFVDLASKLWVLHFAPRAIVINYGVSWGIGAFGLLSGLFFGSLATVVALVFLYYARLRFLQNKGILPEVLIASGALANVFDRILHGGGVIDFIDLSRIGISFPVFNCADVAVVVGVFFLLFREYWYDKV